MRRPGHGSLGQTRDRPAAAACAIAWVLACGVGHALAGAEFQGVVTFSGLPVPGATVIAKQAGREAATVTDQEGAFRLRGLADGPWTVQVEMQGFVTMSREVTVPTPAGGATPVWELMMRPLAEIARNKAPVRSDLRPRPERPASLPPVPDPAGDASTTPLDGFVINGSVSNAAASPFAQPRAFGNYRPQTGTRYSGSLGFVGGSSKWNARPYSFAEDRSRTPEYTDLRFLATFGGPLKLPRLGSGNSRFFIGYQGIRDVSVTTESAVMPTMLERRGDFSRTPAASSRAALIRDPVTGEPFEGNVVPPERMSPQAAALLAYYPAPNLANESRYNYQAQVPSATHQDDVQSRWNRNIKANLLTGTAAYQRKRVDAISIFGFEDTTRESGLDTAVNWSRRLTRRLAIRLRYQFTQLTNEVTPHFANSANVSAASGITGNNQDPVNWGPPRLVVSDVASLGDVQYRFSRARTHATGAEAYLNRGRHNITFGGSVRRHHMDVVSQQDPRGTLSFTGAATGTGLGDLLLGIPTTISIAFGNADKFFRSSSFDAYVNDDARLTPTLTTTVGLRWEYEAPTTEALGRLVNLDIAPNFVAVRPVQSSRPTGVLTGRSFPTSLVRPDKLGLQPRIAVAWRPVPGSSLVVRAGYGVYRNPSVYLPIAKLLAEQPPLSKTFSVQNSAPEARTLADAFAAPKTQVSNTFAVDPDFRVGYAHNWQLSVQRDLPASLLVVASYVGSRGSRLMQQLLPQTYPPGATAPCPSCPAGYVYLASSGSSSRHAARLLLRRRLRGGLAGSVEYTLARATDDASAFSSASLPAASVVQNWLDPDAERAPSNFDQRHLLAAQFEYTTGAGRSADGLLGGWRGSLLKGWTITSTITAGSGRPVTPLYFAPVGGSGIVGVRPDVTPTSIHEAPPGYYVDPVAYTPPAPGRWGNAGRNSIRGPAQFSCDAGIARTFPLGERFNLDWRVDATNVLNRVTFAGMDTVVSSPQFGLPNVANPMRKIQTSLRARF